MIVAVYQQRPYRAGLMAGAMGLLASAFVASTPAGAHGGGLNAQGCHNDRRNGGYHCHRGNSSPARVPKPAPAYVQPQRPLYASCTAARAAGAAPLYRGDAGYGAHLDRDQDGVACEGSSTGGSAVTNQPRTLLQQPALLPPASPQPAQPLIVPIEGRAQVLDGDTIQIGLTRIRLFGIDAFEAEQMCQTSSGENYGCGGRATRALVEKVEGETVVCIAKGRDAYDRQLAVCRAGSTDLASWMARSGHALAYTRYALDYVSDEARAKSSGAGAWDGSFDMPWDFRLTRAPSAAEAQRQSIAPSAKCAIKGNVSRAGERIYHLPSDTYYARTKAENWFCNAAEAERAGFRRAINR